MDLYIIGAVGLIVVSILAFLFYRYIGAIEKAVSALHAKMSAVQERLKNEPRDDETSRQFDEQVNQMAQEGGANLHEQSIQSDDNDEQDMGEYEGGVDNEDEGMGNYEDEVAAMAVTGRNDDDDDVIVVAGRDDNEEAIAGRDEEGEYEESDDEGDEGEIPGLEELNGLSMTITTMGGNNDDIESELLELEEDMDQEDDNAAVAELTEESVRKMKVNKMREVAKDLGIENYATLKKVQLRETILEKLSVNNVNNLEEQEIHNAQE